MQTEMKITVPRGYEALAEVFQQALLQAATGKGVLRHAERGQPFEDQKICRITRTLGLGFPLGQAEKKIEESIRLGECGPGELLGAINYLAAAVLVMIEQNTAEDSQGQE